MLEAIQGRPRVLAWDLFNEVDQHERGYGSLELKNKDELALDWCRRCSPGHGRGEPSQPLTGGLWRGPEWNKPDRNAGHRSPELELSDVITYHSYDPRRKSKRASPIAGSGGRSSAPSTWPAATADLPGDRCPS